MDRVLDIQLVGELDDLPDGHLDEPEFLLRKRVFRVGEVFGDLNCEDVGRG